MQVQGCTYTPTMTLVFPASKYAEPFAWLMTLVLMTACMPTAGVGEVQQQGEAWCWKGGRTYCQWGQANLSAEAVAVRSTSRASAEQVR